MPVIIRYDNKADDLLRQLEFVPHCGGVARKLQPYLVQVPQRDFDALYKAGAVAAVQPKKWEDQFMVLENRDLYDPHFGLRCDEPTFMKVVNTII
jgi:CRISPR-associated endonuclease/helicase Cas3